MHPLMCLGRLAVDEIETASLGQEPDMGEDIRKAGHEPLLLRASESTEHYSRVCRTDGLRDRGGGFRGILEAQRRAMDPPPQEPPKLWPGAQPGPPGNPGRAPQKEDGDCASSRGPPPRPHERGGGEAVWQWVILDPC